MKRWLDTLANLATIAVASVVVWALLTGRPSPVQPVQSGQAAGVQAVYTSGEPAPSIEGLSYASAPRTLLIVARSGCKFCEGSLPFYRRLLQERDKAGLVLQIAFLAPATDEAFKAQLARASVSPDRLLFFRPGQLKVRGTPTAILVDEHGKVQRTWQGQLNTQQESEVLRLVKRQG